MRARPIAFLIALSCTLSCAVDRGGLGADEAADAGRRGDARTSMDAGVVSPRDSGPPQPADARPRDGDSMDAARRDAGPRDAGAPDAGPPDTGPPDAGPPDAGPRPSCDSTYRGVVPGYYRCAETDSMCEFYTNPSSARSCDAICALGRGTCVDAWRELGLCDHREDRACDFAMDDMICLCTR